MELVKLRYYSLWVFSGILFAMIFIILGGGLNDIAVESNGCKMPVKIWENTMYETDTHFGYVHESDINYPNLVDKYYISNENTIRWFSIGDILIWIGELLLCVFLIMLIVHSIKDYKLYKQVKHLFK